MFLSSSQRCSTEIFLGQQSVMYSLLISLTIPELKHAVCSDMGFLSGLVVFCEI